MVFSWSTPLRQNGQTSLPLIPNEIYLAIFECIAPTNEPLSEQNIQTFSALAIVCRFFCSVALPRVFERVAFSGNSSGNSSTINRAEASRKTKWAKQIVANTEPSKSIALYVKECTFDSWSTNKDQQWVLFPFATLYCQAMARMSNIRKVVITKSFVKKEHWDAMAELKQLDDLKFSYCSFIEDPPDKELTVRTVTLLDLGDSPIPFTRALRPIATTVLRSLEINEVEVVQKLVAFRHLAIDNLIVERQIFDIEELLHVFRLLPDLESISCTLRRKEMVSPLIATFSLKKLFTRLRSFTIVGSGCYWLERHDMAKLLSALCDGPGTLPSLEELHIHIPLGGAAGETFFVISDLLNRTIIPAFPNLRYIYAGNDNYLHLEEGNWEVHYSQALKKRVEHEHNKKLQAHKENMA
ncbi:hypothetical protein DEU56DRAFT_909245 [Suillus clintonianus]|uniref:uncharacterized protein n=1 Tax=Suillus clintonianus TaxID=1904413 RepID=UPI001B88487A|nr:uncharacterized protein DEU56DRAFT_909245 [Suillus clintonianus]KAG2148953.1 hypothetical protein DEU56DRAFT_909245 [Suillus clintonianus]